MREIVRPGRAMIEDPLRPKSNFILVIFFVSRKNVWSKRKNFNAAKISFQARSKQVQTNFARLIKMTWEQSRIKVQFYF